MMKYNFHKNTRQSGFTLIEVLVTLVIIAVGLLGLANVQLIGLKNNQSAYQRSQATIAIYDMVERIRSNASEIDNYVATAIEVKAATKVATCTTATGCSTAEMAATDLAEWNELLTQSFGMAEGAIMPDGSIYNITITWDENHDGVIDSNDPTFPLSFRP